MKNRRDIENIVKDVHLTGNAYIVYLVKDNTALIIQRIPVTHNIMITRKHKLTRGGFTGLKPKAAVQTLYDILHKYKWQEVRLHKFENMVFIDYDERMKLYDEADKMVLDS